ncbi:hypothetical protein K438DRAFT_1598365, partial [Mycena galopus ATCC 62051]
MVIVFLQDVLGWQSPLPGLFGHTSAFYGTVEQQGRLTLHLHLLLWVMNALSPQAIRDKIMSQDSVFQKKLVAYLEAAHQGDFIHGSMEDVKARQGFDLHPTPEELDRQSSETYKVPTLTLPRVPPALCGVNHADDICVKCAELANWCAEYEHEIDDLWLRCNLHTCCLSKKGVCKARFPREIFESTSIDRDGHINLKHTEAYLNTMSRALTYFSRSNTDVTSLMSGTAVKAVVSYVSDYVSKLGLKTY